jgi:dolichol-phosphate mannosyltransferase
MEISLVIPAYNEAGNVQPLFNEIGASLDGVAGYEVIYVDDGSANDTINQLLAARDGGFANLRRIQRHRRRCGQSAAILTGVRAARADWIVTLDGDGQNDPADMPCLLAIVRSAADSGRNLQLVTGLRLRRQDSFLKRLSSKIANDARSRLLKDATPDTGCGLKIFSRQAFLELPRFDHMHRFLPALFRRNGGAVEMVEVNHRPRRRGISKYGVTNRLWVGIVDLLGVMWLLRRNQYPESTEVR